MLSPLVNWHIRKRARRKNIELAPNYKLHLSEAIKEIPTGENKITFSWLFDGSTKFPNASATLPKKILVNAEWAALLALHFNDEVVRDSFRMTIGHELTHKEKDFFFLEPFTKAEKFVYWVNEVHADYGAVEKVFRGEAERGMKALEFKRRLKGEKDSDAYMHPSWEHRIEFISKYDFNKELICKIAELVKFKDEGLIEKISNHYDDILLRR